MKPKSAESRMDEIAKNYREYLESRDEPSVMPEVLAEVADWAAANCEPSAREWWISNVANGKNISGKVDLYTAVNEKPQNPPWTHVIEYAAFQRLQERLAFACERLEVREKELDELNRNCISTFLHEQRMAATNEKHEKKLRERTEYFKKCEREIFAKHAAELSLAIQDRDSWKSSFIATRDAANAALEAKEADRVQAVNAMNNAHDALRKAGEYWKDADQLRAKNAYLQQNYCEAIDNQKILRKRLEAKEAEIALLKAGL
jgi:hypothetical protein